MTQPIRVLIVDDDALVRAGLSMMFDGADGITVTAQAADGDEVPAAVGAHDPHVVLMDLRMPRVNGITATSRLRARRNPPEVIVLTTFDTDDKAHVSRILTKLDLGNGHRSRCWPTTRA